MHLGTHAKSCTPGSDAKSLNSHDNKTVLMPPEQGWMGWGGRQQTLDWGRCVCVLGVGGWEGFVNTNTDDCVSCGLTSYLPGVQNANSPVHTVHTIPVVGKQRKKIKREQHDPPPEQTSPMQPSQSPYHGRARTKCVIGAVDCQHDLDTQPPSPVCTRKQETGHTHGLTRTEARALNYTPNRPSSSRPTSRRAAQSRA